MCQFFTLFVVILIYSITITVTRGYSHSLLQKNEKSGLTTEDLPLNSGTRNLNGLNPWIHLLRAPIRLQLQIIGSRFPFASYHYPLNTYRTPIYYYPINELIPGYHDETKQNIHFNLMDGLTKPPNEEISLLRIFNTNVNPRVFEYPTISVESTATQSNQKDLNPLPYFQNMQTGKKLKQDIGIEIRKDQRLKQRTVPNENINPIHKTTSSIETQAHILPLSEINKIMDLSNANTMNERKSHVAIITINDYEHNKNSQATGSTQENHNAVLLKRNFQNTLPTRSARSHQMKTPELPHKKIYSQLSNERNVDNLGLPDARHRSLGSILKNQPDNEEPTYSKSSTSKQRSEFASNQEFSVIAHRLNPLKQEDDLELTTATAEGDDAASTSDQEHNDKSFRNDDESGKLHLLKTTQHDFEDQLSMGSDSLPEEHTVIVSTSSKNSDAVHRELTPLGEDREELQNTRKNKPQRKSFPFSESPNHPGRDRLVSNEEHLDKVKTPNLDLNSVLLEVGSLSRNSAHSKISSREASFKSSKSEAFVEYPDEDKLDIIKDSNNELFNMKFVLRQLSEPGYKHPHATKGSENTPTVNTKESDKLGLLDSDFKLIIVPFIISSSDYVPVGLENTEADAGLTKQKLEDMLEVIVSPNVEKKDVGININALNRFFKLARVDRTNIPEYTIKEAKSIYARSVSDGVNNDQGLFFKVNSHAPLSNLLQGNISHFNNNNKGLNYYSQADSVIEGEGSEYRLLYNNGNQYFIPIPTLDLIIKDRIGTLRVFTYGFNKLVDDISNFALRFRSESNMFRGPYRRSIFDISNFQSVQKLYGDLKHAMQSFNQVLRKALIDIRSFANYVFLQPRLGLTLFQNALFGLPRWLGLI